MLCFQSTQYRFADDGQTDGKENTANSACAELLPKCLSRILFMSILKLDIFYKIHYIDSSKFCATE